MSVRALPVARRRIEKLLSAVGNCCSALSVAYTCDCIFAASENLIQSLVGEVDLPLAYARYAVISAQPLSDGIGSGVQRIEIGEHFQICSLDSRL